MTKKLALSLLFLSVASANCLAQSCQGNVRTRVASPPTVYYGYTGASDSNDGMTTATSLSTPQRAADCASSNFDLQALGNWTNFANVWYRPGIIIQIAPAAQSAPHVVVSPVIFDGLGASGPVYIQCDPAAPSGCWLDFQNTLYGIASQHNAQVIVNGSTSAPIGLMGQGNITLLNGLEHGNIAYRYVHFANEPGGGAIGAVGAADQSSVNMIGDIWLDGPTFWSPFEAITLSRMTLNGTVHINNPISIVGGLYTLGALSTITFEAGTLSYTGAGMSGSTGMCYDLSRGPVMDFPMTWCPPSGGGYAEPGSWGMWGTSRQVKGTDEVWHIPTNTP